ncbi:hypothetical protein A2U01_0099064, partial [Trifolium medium]|nr:hypothetical protein [Trifolium medium]
MVMDRLNACVWKKISILTSDDSCAVESVRDLFPPVAALSDVVISPQS